MQFDSRKNLLTISLILFITFSVYCNSFRNEFVYDDIPLVVENQYVHSWKYLPKLLTTDMWSLTYSHSEESYYRPLPLVSFIIDYSLWGLNPAGYHIVNTFLHACNGILVFLITNSLVGNGYAAAAAGLLFATHPAQTEAVTFISSRGEGLFLFFSLLAIFLFIRGKAVFSTISFLFALLSKETALIMPVFLFLVSYYFMNEKLKFRKFVPYITVMIVYGILRASFLPALKFAPVKTDLDLMNLFVFVIPRCIMVYLKILFFPASLSVTYNMDYQGYLIVCFSALLFLLLPVSAYIFKSKFKIFSFSTFWFYAGLLPAIHIFHPLQYPIAERQLYLPSIGFCIFIGWILVKIAEKYKKLAVSLFIVLIALFSIRTIYRNFDWKNEISLWNKVLEQFPSEPKANLNIGTVYADKGDYKHAMEHYRIALRSNYYINNIRVLMADIYKKTGQPELALNEYKEIIKKNPLMEKVHADMGTIYLNTGRIDKALEEYLFEIKITPKKPELYNNIGIIYAMKKNYSEAEKYFNVALQIDPLNKNARMNLLFMKKKAGGRLN